jgi:hypothetical protein
MSRTRLGWAASALGMPKIKIATAAQWNARQTINAVLRTERIEGPLELSSRANEALMSQSPARTSPACEEASSLFISSNS